MYVCMYVCMCEWMYAHKLCFQKTYGLQIRIYVCVYIYIYI